MNSDSECASWILKIWHIDIDIWENFCWIWLLIMWLSLFNIIYVLVVRVFVAVDDLDGHRIREEKETRVNLDFD